MLGKGLIEEYLNEEEMEIYLCLTWYESTYWIQMLNVYMLCQRQWKGWLISIKSDLNAKKIKNWNARLVWQDKLPNLQCEEMKWDEWVYTNDM